MNTDTYVSLIKDIEASMKEYEKIIGVSAIATRQMFDRYGCKETLEKLVLTSDQQSGFKRLVKAGKSELTFEAIVIRHKYLFSRDVVDAARWQLKQVKVKID